MLVRSPPRLGQEAFHTCPLVELGFLRVSMGPAFRVPFVDAARALGDIKGRTTAQRLADDLDTANLPPLTSHAEVTDAYLVELARSKGLRLATLDEALCATAWATGIAFHPFPFSRPPA